MRARLSARWPRSFQGLGVASLAGLVLGGCFLIRSTINDSPSIRWWLFSNFGASKFCPEMLNRGAPLRWGSSPEAVGRFFPSQCQAQVDEERRTLTLQFGGSGYAWTPLAGRLGFECTAAVEYRPDFAMTEDALYVWAQTQQVVQAPSFRLLSVENPLANWAAQGPGAYLAQQFGEQVISGELAKGFTVVRSEDGDDFSLGRLIPPERPQRPFSAGGQSLVVFNDSLNLQVGQVDFLSPVVVEEEGLELKFKWRSAGPAADVFLLPRDSAKRWRSSLERGAPNNGLPGPAVTSWVMAKGQAEVVIPVSSGQYTVVVDHSPRAGKTHPPVSLLPVPGQGALRAAVIVELRERDD